MHPDLQPNYQDYLLKSSRFERTLAGAQPIQPVYALLEADEEALFPFVEINRISCGDPNALKRFDHLVFYGKGTLFVRALVDGVEVARGWVVMGMGPLASNVFRLPDGTAGAILAVQVGGTGEWSYFDLEWMPIGGG